VVTILCLDNTDVIEGGAATDAVVEYTMHGLVGTTFTQLAAGVMNTTLTAALYTAGAAVSVVSIILVNTHSAAVAVTLRLDPADGGNPRYIIPKTVSLGIGHSLHTDGARITVMDASGQIIHGYPSPLGPTKGGTGVASYTKGDLLHASATNVLGTLAIGTANYKMFANAAGDLPEWAAGIKMGVITKNTADADGTNNISGVGFKPSNVIFFANTDGTVQASVGFDNGTLHYVLAKVLTNWGNNTTVSILLYQSAGVTYTGYISALGSDGFTITWVKAGAKTGTAKIFYMAFR